MPEPGLAVETALPLACRAGTPTPAASHGNLLLLRVVNMLDIREPEQDRAQERVEARLDLMLHWLGMALFAHQAAPAPVPARLEAERIAWAASSAPGQDEIVLDLYIHPGIAAPLQMAAQVVGFESGRVVAELRFDSEELSDAWTQWLFRRHRRAVHEARSRDEQG